ncbi:creatininase family protein [Methyloversatilis sp. XJ19-49]|uniref:creatininase family protein n=1 Tax=Methyloversatilis sp. XJ19-49 TaxID=2963429 RepID=UPI00211C8027|nr:creatininase family protein [Methyloversatilis sp. XJ19-49]MCQ9378341.1 creatininase family protein [Methyloversatilis sp. XJ19-49]
MADGAGEGQSGDSPWWQDLTPRDIVQRAARGGVALLPLAAIEQHGEHLPLSTDLDIANGLVAAALPRVRADVPVCVLPPLAVGLSLEHTGFAGTLSMSPETALAVLGEMGDSVARAGFRRLVLFNSHGGNKALVDLAALKLRAAHGMLVVRANYFRFALPSGVLDADELRHGLHGGALETSMMLHLVPHAVRREALGDFRSLGVNMAADGCLLGPEGEAGFGWMAQDLHGSGATGNAQGASAALGARLVDHFAARLAQLIDEAHDFDLAQLKPVPR